MNHNQCLAEDSTGGYVALQRDFRPDVILRQLEVLNHARQYALALCTGLMYWLMTEAIIEHDSTQILMMQCQQKSSGRLFSRFVAGNSLLET